MVFEIKSPIKAEFANKSQICDFYTNRHERDIHFFNL